MELNFFSDLTKEELSQPELSVPGIANLTNDDPVPIGRYTNWADQGVVSAPGFQGLCNAGYAFAAASAVESAYLIKDGGHMTPLSPQQILDCASKDKTACFFGTFEQALDYYKDNSAVTDSNYPY